MKRRCTSRLSTPPAIKPRTPSPPLTLTPPDARVLSRRQAGRYLGVSARTMQNLERRGALVRVALVGQQRRRALYDKRDLDRLIESSKQRRRPAAS
jgi:hypothetical protein